MTVFAISNAPAAVDRIEIISREPVLAGRAFGSAGSFEKISGRVYFKVQPADPHNQVIVDLDKVVTDADGAVGFSADFCLIRPTDMAMGNGSVLLEIPNRGAKHILALTSAFPTTSDIGDGWLLSEGYTVAWIGWQWDLEATPGALRLYAPVAYEQEGESIRGLLRNDFTPNKRTNDLPLGHQIIEQIGGSEYPVSDPDDRRNTLTVRDAPDAPRRPVPRAQWSFAHRSPAGNLVPDKTHIHLQGDFEPGKTYELIYAVQDPVVAGLGLAAVRDFVSYLKESTNQLATVERAYAIGGSQSGRFLRHFLYQNFNADEHGAKVFDGIMAHVAGAGRGSFNHRFAQPSRSAGSMDAFFHPTDLFPFTDLPQRDPVTGQTAGLLDAATASGVVPKIFYSNTSAEYWSRAASLIHTSPDGKTDAKIADDTRIYTFAGLSHFSWQFPPVYGPGDMKGRNLTNPNPIRFAQRAMIANMNAWVRDGIEPPASNYPRISDGTLVPLGRVAFPKIPGIEFPTQFWEARRLDFGPEWNRGVITVHPPALGQAFTTLLPQVDSDGIDLGGIRLPEVAVPLGTATGWNLRDPSIGAEDQLASFVGSYLPFSATAATRQRSGDPRPALTERYASEEEYRQQFRSAVENAVAERWMLEQDFAQALDAVPRQWRSINRLAR